MSCSCLLKWCPNVHLRDPGHYPDSLLAPAQQFPFPCAPCKLRHCLSYSRRRDRINLGLFWSWDNGGGGATRRTTCPQNTARQVVDDQSAEGSGQQRPRNDPRSNQHNPSTPTTGLRQRESRNTGRSGRQTAATRRNMQREERVTVQGPVKKQQPDGMSHRGGLWSHGYVCTV